MRTAIVQVGVVLLLYSGAALCADLSEYEKTCAELGFRPRTPAYGECVLELDRRAKVGQQSNRSRVDQEQRQAEQRRQEETAMSGDGTPDHQTCYRYGFRPGTTPYAECRLKLDIARRELEQKQADYEMRQREYVARQAEYENELDRRRRMAALDIARRLAGGQGFANSIAGAAGIAPIAPQRPSMENYFITMPGGRNATCTYVPSMRSMSCY